jgi:hypothetical protein
MSWCLLTLHMSSKSQVVGSKCQCMKHATEHSHRERCLRASSWEGSRFQRSRPLGHKCRDRMGVMGVTNIRPHDCWLEIDAWHWRCEIQNPDLCGKVFGHRVADSHDGVIWECYCTWSVATDETHGIVLESSFLQFLLFCSIKWHTALQIKVETIENSTSLQSVDVMLMTPSMVVNGKASCQISARNTLDSIEMLKLMTGYDQSKMQHLSHWNLSFYPILLSILSLATVWKAASRWDPSCPGCKATKLRPRNTLVTPWSQSAIAVCIEGKLVREKWSDLQIIKSTPISNSNSGNLSNSHESGVRYRSHAIIWPSCSCHLHPSMQTETKSEW